MAIVLNDNIDTRAGKPTDNRFGTTLLGTAGFYASVNDANTAIPAYQRYIGLTVGIKVGNNPMKEYWYANGITNNDLVEKSGSVSGAGNGLTNTGGTIGLGGTLSEPTTTITTGPSNTLAIAGLQTNNSPSNILVTNSSNVVQSIPYSTFLSNISTSITTNIIAENGLSKPSGFPGTIRLGGDLLANTNTVINLGTSAANTDAGLFIENKFRNRASHCSYALTRSAATFDTFDNVEFLPGFGWTLGAGWTGNASDGFVHTSGTATLTNSEAPTASTQYYVYVYIKPTGTNLSVTGSITVSFGGVNTGMVAINETTTVEITTSTTAGIVVAPTNDFNGNVKFSVNRKSTADAASRTRIITFKSSGAIWTRNVVNSNQTTPFPEQIGWNEYLYSKPWLFTLYPTGNYPAGANFQFVDNALTTGRGGAGITHYLDERVSVNNIAWWNTFSSPTAPNANGKTFNIDYGGWVAGKVYTLKNKATLDSFPAGMASSTIRGSANSSGWVFVSNGTSPTTWANGSIIEGDFPIVEVSPRSASINVYEGQDPSAYNYQKGTVAISAQTTIITGLIDQGNSSRGFRLSIIGAGDPLPTDATVGEIFYRVDDSSIVFKVSDSPVTWKRVNTTTTT